MTRIRHLGILICILPLLVFFGGVIHIHPEAALEFDRLCESTKSDVCQLGQQIIHLCEW